MLNFWLATQVIDGKMNLEEAERISSELGNKIIPDTVSGIIKAIEVVNQ